MHERMMQIMNFAVKMKYITDNPAKELAPKHVDPQPHETWEQEEIDKILSVHTKSAYGCLWLIMLSTGLRRSEVLALEWSDINWRDGYIDVQRGAVPVDHEVIVGTTKSTSSTRHVFVPNEIMDALREHKVTQDNQKAQLRGAYQDTDLVFASRVGTMIGYRNLKRDLDRLCKLAGVKQITIHETRHTFATRLLEAGANLGGVSALLGHDNVYTTSQTYLYVSRGMAKDASKMTSSILFAPNRQAIAAE